MEEFYSNICIIFATYLNNAYLVNFKDVSNFRFFSKKKEFGTNNLEKFASMQNFTPKEKVTHYNSENYSKIARSVLQLFT
jgi:hypothetical protein